LLNGWGASGIGRGLAAVFDLVEAAITDEGGEGGGVGDVETGVAVEEAAFKNVGAEEAPAGPEDGGRGGELGAARGVLADKEVGERVDLRDVGGERRKRVVVEIGVLSNSR
jgi:hypothetical protein